MSLICNYGNNMKVDNKPESILVKYDQADSLEHLLLLSGFVY